MPAIDPVEWELFAQAEDAERRGDMQLAGRLRVAQQARGAEFRRRQEGLAQMLAGQRNAPPLTKDAPPLHLRRDGSMAIIKREVMPPNLMPWWRRAARWLRRRLPGAVG